MNNKKQTAVIWQFDELQKAEKDYKNEAINGLEYTKKKYEILIQAKAMEKEQIENGWDNGFLDYQISMHEDAEQYYKETYEQ